jgi:hypothetical protein
VANAKTIIIQGMEFTVTHPYDAGHVLTEAEARSLNQTRAENIRNNFATVIKAAHEGKEGAPAVHDLPAKYAEYEAAYSFSMPGQSAGKPKLDPIEREARKLAKEILVSMLTKAGRKLGVPGADSTLTKEQQSERDEKPDVLKKAKENVAKRAKSIDELSEGVEI